MKTSTLLLVFAIACGSKDAADDSTEPSDSADSAEDCAPLTWYADADGDGHGDPSTSSEACEAPEGFVADADDCDDTDPAAFPGAEEAVGCDGVDQDCDGDVDEGRGDPWYPDLDSDGYGDPALSQLRCSPVAGWTGDNQDCDDADAAVFPGAPEGSTCDNIDQDCDGSVDEGAGATWYLDADRDGYGDSATAQVTCNPGPSWVQVDGDCDDTRGRVSPGRSEAPSCDGLDNDCDSLVDEGNGSAWYMDFDGDGQGDPAAAQVACSAPARHVSDSRDCDDYDPVVCEGCVELCDGKDNDCDGSVDLSSAALGYSDLDGDGYGDAANPSYELCGGWIADDSDCDDGDAGISPGANESCASGQDEDCDGLSDCDDADCAADAACAPEAVCDDGVDDDSDGLVDCEDADCVSDPACAPEAVCDDATDNDNDGLIDCDDADCWATCGGGTTMTVQVTGATDDWALSRGYGNTGWMWYSAQGGSPHGGAMGRDIHDARFNGVYGVATLRTASGASSSCGWEVEHFHRREGERTRRSTWSGMTTYELITPIDQLTRSSFAWSSGCAWTSIGSSVLPQSFQTLTRLNRAVYLADGRAWYAPTYHWYTGGGSGGYSGRRYTDSQGRVWYGWIAHGDNSSAWEGSGAQLGPGATYTQYWP